MSKQAIIKFLVFGILCFSSAIASAANITWDGEAGDGLWESPTNWVGDVLPSFSDAATIDNGDAVTINSSIDLIALFVNGTSSLTVAPSFVLNVAEPSGTPVIIQQNASLTINGTMNVTTALLMNINNEGTLAGSGEINLNGNAFLFDLNCGGNSITTFSGTLNITNTAANTARINNSGMFTGSPTINITNTANGIVNSGTFNSGFLTYSNCTGVAINNSGDFFTLGAVIPDGTTLIDNSGTFTFTSGFVQLSSASVAAIKNTSGATFTSAATVFGQNNVCGLLNEGTFYNQSYMGFVTNADHGINNSGTFESTGILGGFGPHVGITIIGGMVSPGSSPGEMTFDDDIAFTANFEMEIEGETPGTGFDQVNVEGEADLTGANFEVVLLNGYLPTCSTDYEIFTATSFSGPMPTATPPPNTPDITWSVVQSDEKIIVKATFIEPEINIKGNIYSIENGDSTPHPDDLTDYGTVCHGLDKEHVFEIENIGTGDLTLSGSPLVSISGSGAADFVVTTMPDASISSGGGSTNLGITFTPSVGGVRNAIVTIENDDCDEAPYSFSIRGLGGELSCYTPGVILVLESQADVDNFSLVNPCCTKINGSLRIDESVSGDITNLNGLSQLEEIGENLQIYDTDGLMDLSGLENIHTIGTRLDIQSDGLLSTDGMSGLTSIGERFSVDNAQELTLITGFDALLTIGDRMRIYNNDKLITMEGFGQLTTISNRIEIDNHALLTSIPLFTNLGTVSDRVSIINNSKLQSIAGFNNLTSVGSGVYLNNNSELGSISGFNSITSLPERLDIDFNPNLLTITGFTSLTHIMNRLYINRDEKLTSLVGFSNLKSIGNRLTLRELYDITNFNGLHNVETLGERLWVHDCRSITDFTGLESIMSVGHRVEITSNDLLASFDGLENLGSLGERLVLRDNLELTNILALTTLTAIPDRCEMVNNPKLSSLDGLENLVSIGENLYLRLNTAMTNISALSNLTSIGNRIQIEIQHNLNSLDGLQQVTSIGDRLRITQCNGLTDFSGLDGLLSIGERLEIEDCDELISFAGLENVTSIGETIKLLRNDKLENLDVFSNVTSINGEIKLDDNDKLDDIEGLNNIDPSTITNLDIRNNAILSLCSIDVFCDYLDAGGSHNFSNNAVGCNNITEVEAVCNACREVTWDGEAGDNLWSSPTNWDTDAVPIACDEVFIDNGDAILIDDAQAISSLEISGGTCLTIEVGGSLTIDESETVGLKLAAASDCFINEGTATISNSMEIGIENLGTFTNEGTLETDGVDNDETFTNNGTVTNKGVMKGNKMFTIPGDYFNLLGARFRPGSSPGTLSIDGDFDLGAGTYDAEIFGVTPSTEYDVIEVTGELELTNANLNVDFGSFTPIVGNSFVIATFDSRVGEFANVTMPSFPGIVLLVIYNPTNVTLTASVALPVALSTFSAEAMSDFKTMVEWQTLSEQDNLGFEVEHSVDGSRWNSIGFVEGSANSSEQRDYHFVHANALNGINYYRLMQLDFNGNFEYSTIVSVTHKERENEEISVFPNPVNSGQLFIKKSTASSSKDMAFVYDANGQTVLMQNLENERTRIDVSSLNNGVYFIIIHTKKDSYTSKVLIQND